VMLGWSEGFLRQGPYENAGHMSLDVAREIIQRCAQEYVDINRKDEGL
jgi:hypothetical protein